MSEIRHDFTLQSFPRSPTRQRGFLKVANFHPRCSQMGWIRGTRLMFYVIVAVAVLVMVWTQSGHLPTGELAGAEIRPGFETVRPSAVPPDRQNDWLKKTLDDLPLGMVSRDVTWQEEWPDVEGPRLSPDHVVPPTVHYLWSGRDRLFTFQHYLGVLSALRITKPLGVVFHYTDNPPVVDSFRYNSWFSELNKTVPFLDLRKLPVTTNYTAVDVLISILDLVSREGGVFLGERVVLARSPPHLSNRTSWFASSHKAAPGLGPALLFLKDSHSHSGFNVSAVLLSSGDTTCVTVDTFNKVGPGPGRECVLLTPDTPQHPRDIWGSSTPYAELARWLFYGRRARLQVKPDQRQPIPRITHYVRLLSTEYHMYTEELSFSHFIGILSALYVAGFHHVYLHVTHELTGRWWEELRGENITVLRLQESHTVFQQKVTWIKHISDLSRYNVVYKYGGAYQDFDVVWTSYVPDKLLAYPTVISPAISSNGLWPGGLSVGLFLARPRAPFLRHFLQTYSEYRANMPLYNSVTMSYRTMEFYPDTVLVEPRIQVICFNSFCYPHWQRPPLWDLRRDGGNGYNWTECHAVHIPAPKPAASFLSPAALRNGSDMYAHIGRWVLDRSGRSRLLKQP